MKKISYIIILILTSISFGIYAKDYKVEDISLVRYQDKTKYVTNPDGILDAQTVYAIDTTLYALEKQTGIQTAVVVVSNIEGGDCFDFALQLAEKNKVGQKDRDNGLVILLVTNERCIQFVTGYGLEGDFPDAMTKRIQNRYMLPYFRQGNWNDGMLAGIQATRKVLDGSMENIGNDDDDEDFGITLTIIMGIIIIIVALFIFLRWYNNRCPVCKKHHIQRLSSRIISRSNGVITEEVTYKCLDCGNVFKKIEKKNDDNFRGPHRGGGGPIIGGFGGFGGGSGGGSIGGGFGGGSFGGGGGGSRW